MGRPLDKKEAVLYGRFINAAYTMFERAPADPHPLQPRRRKPRPLSRNRWSSWRTRSRSPRLCESDMLIQAKERRPRRSFVVTGHSLGSALATLFVMENKEKNKFDISTVCTFASPRVGNAEFVNQFNQLPLTSWRIVNTRDIVPKLPLHLPFFNYQHVAMPYEFSSVGEVKGNPLCWHSMSTYLHWLDSTISVDEKCRRSGAHSIF